MPLARKYGRISIDARGHVSGSGGNEWAGLCIVEQDGKPVGTATWQDYRVAYMNQKPLRFGPYLLPELAPPEP